MNRFEQMTRAAARLVGRDVSGYEWRDDVLGLVEQSEYVDKACSMVAPNVFAPLSDPCDAFIVEASLPISVRCEYSDGRLAMYASTPKPGLQDLGYMASALAASTDDVLRTRMRVVTQFAELISLAEQCDG